MTGNFKKLGMSMSRAITLPLAIIGGLALKTAVKFEASMAKVKAVSGATAGEFKSLTASAKELGRTTVFTASEVAGLQLEFAKLGFTASQINQVTEATLNLAQATGSDLAQAAEVAGATLGGFGLAASETGRVADVMAASFSTSALDINHFQESMKLVAPNAKAAGVSLEETTAMLAVLSKAGIKGSSAGTALRRILQEMQGTSGTLTERFAELNKAGLDVQGSMDEVGRRAGTSLLVLAEGSGEVQSLTDSYKDSDGAAKAMADVMNNTTAGAMKRMTSALEGAAFVIGDALVPALNSVATFVTDLASDFSNLSKSTQKNILIVAGLVAALGPLLIILPLLASSLPIIAGAFAAMTGPIGLAVIGYTALVVGINRLIKSSKDIPSTLEQANKSVKDHTTEVRYLVGQYKDESNSLEDRKRILGRLAEIDATHFGNLSAENTKYKDLVKNLDDYTSSLRASYLEKALSEEGSELMSDLVKAEEKIIKKRLNLQKGYDDDWNQGEVSARENALRNAEKGRDIALKALEDFEIKKLELLKKYATVDTDEDIIVTPDPDGDTGDTGDKGDLGSKAPPALEGSIDALREKVALLTTDYNAAVIGSEAFNVASTELAVATLDLDTALEALKDKEDIIDEVFPTGSLAQLNASLSLLNEELLLLVPGSEAFIDKMEEIEAMSDIINPKVTALADVANTTSTAFSNLGSQISGAFVDAVLDAQNFGDAMIAIGKQLIKTLLSEAIASAVANAASSKNIVNQASGGLTIPAFIAAAVGTVKGAFSNIPQLADGGIAYGRSLVEVGEYSGAQGNPEVIAPLNKLQDMLGGNSIQVYGRISGDDIVISNNRATRDRNRF
tara:strand:+ start:11 stop:2557 length:2547 start_codon:yes stop_codon:yes gene_type:complete